MTHTASDPPLVRVLWVAELAALAVITLAYPGSTRMYAWPWTLALAVAVTAPAFIVIARAFAPRRPLLLPSAAWTWMLAGTVAVILGSALLSPYRTPSLWWSTPLLGSLAFGLTVFDWLHRDPAGTPARQQQLVTAVVVSLGLVGLVGFGYWLAHLPPTLAAVWDTRNPYPLGHSSYTAGIALLLLPAAVAVAFRGRGIMRAAAVCGILLAVWMLFTSGSRGGIIGLGALAIAAFWQTRIPWRRKAAIAVVAAPVALLLALAHPRTRAMFLEPDDAASPNISNVQRASMLRGAWQMGLDRPVAGWGPGTTPLAYPRFRAAAGQGAENVLQLHNSVAQLWAEFGALGVLGALGALFLIARGAARHPVASVTLFGYAVFSLFDWQLGVPIFGFTVAALAALLASPPSPSPTARGSRIAGMSALAALALTALLGGRDPTPELNVRALAIAREAGGADRAIARLRESLDLNPDQEIAHFNLGWLLVTREPAAAARHFLAAAQLVPDKGGVYFGLGLAWLNQGSIQRAAQAFALECLNDPRFLHSPWWREPVIAAVRESSRRAFTDWLDRIGPQLTPGSWAARQEERLRELAPTLGRVPGGAGERVYRRERSGYPVLMRNLDLPPPLDLYDVRESVTPEAELLPPKGWLPSHLVLPLLHEIAR